MDRQNKRHFTRIKKTLYVQCRVYSEDSWSSVTTQDVSEAGMSFLAGQEIPIGKMVEIRLTTFLQRDPMVLVGKVVDCKEKYEGKNWIVRVSIEKINEMDRPMFSEFMQIFLKLEQNKGREGAG